MYQGCLIRGRLSFLITKRISTKNPGIPPPGWVGVSLKDIITGKETGGAFSYHLVKITRHCEVPSHDHETQWEWNVILKGTGSFVIQEKETQVTTGETYVTPPGISHTVKAGNSELVITAVFVPALG
ncbi:cupin domain-containing protein [Methanospirillum lacunae]|uniref:Cupin domain-containing protein n=1 Tax=Methanospirillum lacunae TaxID=668570 RepID=A0A2V2MP04_9EURY|nr:cupin domain-containing protein [Methanospirillum lacunae]